VKHGEKADLGAQVLGISGDGEQGFRRGPEQDGIELSLILIGNCCNLLRLQRKPEPEGLPQLEQQLTERMAAVDIVDAMSDTDHWLNWTYYFGAISRQ
jgi:hypothetical protein